MPLPQSFSEFEHLQSVVRKIHNRSVQQYFRNQDDNDISTPKASLKHACLIKDDDTQAIMLQRQWLFEITAGNAQSLAPEIYGIPVAEYQRDVKFRPQVKLYFKQSRSELTPEESGLRQGEGQITFRLMDETSETISRAKAERLARDIKREFGTPLERWEKGRFKCTYQDAVRGYDLRLLVKNRTEGERLVRKVLGVQGHTYDDENFQFIDNNLPLNPIVGSHRVYGRQTRKPIKRPTVSVIFLSAQLFIWGRPKPVNLVSHGNRLRSVIEYI